MPRTLRCRLGRHRWIDQQSKIVCRNCGRIGRKHKTFLCYLGLHSWVTMVNEGERYLACRRCSRYRGAPGSMSGWRSPYDDPGTRPG